MKEVGTTTKAEYSWSDLLDKVADVRRERDQFFEELESEKARGDRLRDELLEALGGKRARREGIPCCAEG